MSATASPFRAVRIFRSCIDRSVIHVLDNGMAVRHGITGRMLLTEVGGKFVRYLDDDEQVVADADVVVER